MTTCTLLWPRLFCTILFIVSRTLVFYTLYTYKGVVSGRRRNDLKLRFQHSNGVAHFELCRSRFDFAGRV